MLRNYLLLAARNLRKRPAYSFINIFGLAVGLTSCILILLFIQHELSYDSFHENEGRIYRLIRQTQDGIRIVRSAQTESAYAVHLKESFPEIDETVRLNQADAATLEYGNERFRTDGLFFADPSLFQVFSFELEKGDPRSALTTPASVLLSKEAAGFLFGQSDPLGETVQLDGEIDLTVTGILEEVPSNSHLQFDVLVSSDVMRQVWRPNILENYRNWIFYTYLLLSPGADPESLQEKLPDFIDRYQGEESNNFRSLELQPLSAVHFETATRREVSSNINRRILYIYGATALLILLISCVNFTNLSTARASERAREVGIRKVLGAHRSQLIGQFMGEAVLLSLISSGIAVVLTGVFLPSFGELVSRPLSISQFNQFNLVLLVVGPGLFTGIFAGL